MSNLINPFKKREEAEGQVMAFPIFGLMPGQTANSMTAIVQPGMTLRDYFAGQYISGAVQAIGNLETIQETEAAFDDFAKEAYRMADCMLSQREKGGKKS